MATLLRRVFDARRKMFRFLIIAAGLAAVSCGANAITISDNLGNALASTEFVGEDTWVAAEFATDGTPYTLSSITLLLDTEILATARLDLYADSGSKPGTLLGTLISPSIPSTLLPAVFGGNGIALQPNSLYWAVLSAPSGGFAWGWTASSSGTGAGFLHTWGATDDAGASWFTSDIEPLLMNVSATGLGPADGVPEPGSFGLLAFFGLPALALLVRCSGAPRSAR